MKAKLLAPLDRKFFKAKSRLLFHSYWSPAHGMFFIIEIISPHTKEKVRAHLLYLVRTEEKKAYGGVA